MKGPRLFWAVAAALLPVCLAGPELLRRALLERERALADNAVWRAVEAADRGDVATARRETALALVPPLAREELWDDALRFGLLPGVAESRLLLAERLAALGLAPEARLSAWAAIRAYHARPRPSFDPRPWRLLRDASPAGSPARSAAERALALARGPVPPAPSEAVGAPVTQEVDLRALEPASNGYARLEGRAGVALRQALVRLAGVCAVSVSLQVTRSAEAIRIEAEGHELLGLPPVLLLSVDGGEPWTVFVSAGRRAYRVDAGVAPGRHTLVLELLNGFALREGGQRHVELSRLALVP